MNPIFKRTNNNNNDPLSMLNDLIASGQSPQQIIQNIMTQNPQVKNILESIKQSGKSPQEFVKFFAQKNNIDLSPYLKALANRGIKL